MNEPEDPRKDENLVEAAKTEISQMAKQGLDHPSSKPVIIGALIGAAVGWAVLDGAWFLGLLVGALIALYQRLKK